MYRVKIRTIVLSRRGEEPPAIQFKEPGLYRYVRHPIMLGFIIGFWATPDMSQGHLLFAVVTTVYIFIGIKMEERDLINALGATYEQYRKRVGMLIPRRGQSTEETASEETAS